MFFDKSTVALVISLLTAIITSYISYKKNRGKQENEDFQSILTSSLQLRQEIERQIDKKDKEIELLQEQNDKLVSQNTELMKQLEFDRKECRQRILILEGNLFELQQHGNK